MTGVQTCALPILVVIRSIELGCARKILLYIAISRDILLAFRVKLVSLKHSHTCDMVYEMKTTFIALFQLHDTGWLVNR